MAPLVMLWTDVRILLVDTTRVWWRLLPKIVAIYLLGWLGYELAFQLAVIAGDWTAWASLVIFASAFVFKLVSIVLILRLAGNALGIRELIPDEEYEDDGRDASITRLLAITLLPFLGIYAAFGEGGVTAFVNGGGSILNSGLGLPVSLSATILATTAVLFAATTMDTGVRLQRFVVQEIGQVAGVKLGTAVSTVIVLVVCLGLTFSAGGDGSGGMLIWPLFGTTNPLLAGLTLAILAVMLMRKRRPVLPIMIPLVFVLFVSVYAAIIQLGTFYRDGNWLLLVLDVIILIAAVWVIVESAVALNRARKDEPELDDEDERASIDAGGSSE